jgi:autotransporter-associated beta strand protein
LLPEIVEKLQKIMKIKDYFLASASASWRRSLLLGTALVALTALPPGEAGAQQYWDGANMTPGNVADGRGGTGFWNATNTNWTNQAGSSNTTWQGGEGILGGQVGTVFITGTQGFTSLSLLYGYRLSGGTLDASGPATITVASNRSVILDSVISGSAGLTVAGGTNGILNLTASNTYTGGTTFNSGFVNVTSDTNLGAAGQGLTFNGGTFRGNGVTTDRATTLNAGGGFFNISSGATFTHAGVIGGTGALTLTGNGGTVVLAGANTYTGGTVINAGALQIGNGGTSGQLGPGGVTLGISGARLVINRSDTFTLDNVIDGLGRVHQAGTGTTILTGANTYANGTLVTGGTLQIGDGGTTGTAGTGSVFLQNGSAVAFNRGDVVTVTNAIIGNGHLTLMGSGTVILAALGAYSGTTTISAGTFQVGDGGTVGSLGSGAVTNNASLVFNRSDALTVANAIGGTGSVTQAGTGTVILTGASTYTGGTTVNGGTLQLSDGGTTGSILGGVVLQNGGTLVFDRSDNNATLGGPITGSGHLVNRGTGMLTLGAVNSFTGTATIEDGTLALTGNGKLGAGTVALSLGANARFDVSDTNPGNNVVLAALNGGGSVWLGARSLTLGGSGQTGSYAGVIRDGGMEGGTGARLIVAGGTTILSGANTYTGGTTIQAGGTLQLGDGGTTGSVQGAILNNGTLAVDRSNLLAMTNAISGAGQVVMNGTGTLALRGANSFAGGVTVNAGTLTFINQTSASTGAITLNGGALRPNVFSAGSLSLNNAILFGAHGGTVSGANQQAEDTPGQPVIGTLNLTLAGVTGGAGVMNVAGPGTVIVTGDSTRTGQTSIAAGATLQVGQGGTTGSIGSGDIVNNGTLNLNRSDAVSYAGQVSGTGAVNILTGQVLATGALGHTGGTSIASGAALQIGNGGATGSLAGNVVNNGSLIFNRAGSLTVPGAISGTGGLTQNGPGNLILTGASSYTGATQVNGGTLSVNGSIANSTVTIRPGGTLGGTGTTGPVSVANGATLAPGNSIGTLNVASLVLSSGATTVMEVQGGTADRINVSGNATLGGTLRLLPLGGPYSFNTPYILIQAASVSGNFASVNTSGSFGAGVTPTVSVTGTQVLLGLTPAILVPETGGGNDGVPNFASFNQRATAGALDAANRAGANLSPFFNVFNQPASTIGLAVNQLSGEVATSTGAMGFASGDQFLATLLDPLGVGRESMLGGRLRVGGDGGSDGDGSTGNAKRYAVWGTATGAYNRTTGDSSDGSASRTARSAGFALGFDHLIGAQSMAGVAIAVGESSASLASGQGSATANFGQIGAYGTTRLGSFTVSGAGAFTFMDVDTKRTLYFLNSDQQRAGFGAQVYSLRAEARQDGLAFGGGFRVLPIAALQWQQVNNQGYTESSYLTGRTYGVAVGGQSQTSLRSELGAQVDGTVRLGSVPVQGYLRASWAHYMTRDASMAVGFASLPNAGFTVRGARPDANAALLSGGVEMPIAAGLTLGARVDSAFSGNVTQVAGTARLRYRF